MNTATFTILRGNILYFAYLELCYLICRIKKKPVLNGHSQKDPKLFFKTNYCLMQVKSIAEWDLH